MRVECEDPKICRQCEKMAVPKVLILMKTLDDDVTFSAFPLCSRECLWQFMADALKTHAMFGEEWVKQLHSDGAFDDLGGE